MNKTELVGSIAAKSGLSKADSKKALDACVEAIVEALKGGDKVSLVVSAHSLLLSVQLVRVSTH